MQSDVQRLINVLREQPRQKIFELFNTDEQRFGDFSARLDDLLLDFSKTAISRESLSLLLQLVEAGQVEARRDAMFRGDKINSSEQRAVLHTALRADGGQKIMPDGEDVMPAVLRARADMLQFADACRSGAITAADGGGYTDVVNIGIGGSDLGAAMAVEALAPYGGKLRLHFVSNMDGAHAADTLARLQPARTLVIISSKSFTTIETMTNAHAARQWLSAALGEAAAGKQCVAVTAAAQAAQAFEVSRIFAYDDWIGGRYSLWGAVGLPLALAIGSERFGEFLSGARAMDIHFCSAPAAKNLPILMALVGIWHRNICRYPTRAVLPYDQRLNCLPAYLQQLEMESNGKSVAADDTDTPVKTVPVVWGSAGTNAQHAYFQLLHQGTDIVPAEFIVAACPLAADSEQHKMLLANCLAQTAALMNGDTSQASRQRRLLGNRPSVTILHRQLTPYALGRLIALYEHRTFTEGVLWGINSFDQWGVELGKVLAKQIAPLLNDSAAGGQDASTQGLLNHYHLLANALPEQQ